MLFSALSAEAFQSNAVAVAGIGAPGPCNSHSAKLQSVGHVCCQPNYAQCQHRQEESDSRQRHRISLLSCGKYSSLGVYVLLLQRHRLRHVRPPFRGRRECDNWSCAH